MKKLFFILALICCVSAINAQDTVYVKRESTQVNYFQNNISFSFGDGLIFSEFDIYDSFGSYSLSYHYGMKKWLALGGFVSYLPIREYDYDYIYSSYYGGGYTEYISHYVLLNVSLRFTYLNRPNAMLYSGVALGFGQVFSTGKKMRISPSGQVTFLGFAFGKKFYIGGEIGIGAKGFFNTSIGYRF